jgi:hypothetical protein
MWLVQTPKKLILELLQSINNFLQSVKYICATLGTESILVYADYNLFLEDIHVAKQKKKCR